MLRRLYICCGDCTFRHPRGRCFLPTKQRHTIDFNRIREGRVSEGLLLELQLKLNQRRVRLRGKIQFEAGLIRSWRADSLAFVWLDPES
jgi:hypothetical protein